MQASRNPRGGRTAPVAVLLACAALAATPLRPAAAQTYAQKTAAAVDYILVHSERESMMRVPMRNGVRLSATMLFPTDRPRQNLPTVLIFIPYLTEGTIRGGLFSGFIRSFIENGYAVMIENVRGRYFSEGTYTYLVGSGNDGYDTIEWISKQTWSNGKVGTIGCSSSAEEQHKMNAARHPAHAAAVPMGSGAGIGKVGPYNEMGNFYRGGAVQGVWFSWYYGAGYKYHPTWPANLTREQMLRVSKFWNMEPELMPRPNLDSAVWTLPINKIMHNLAAMPSDMDDFVNRLPNDPKWKEIEFGGEGDRSGAPTLYINSWYDLSIGPNVAMFDYQTKNAATETARNNIFMVVAPTLHCNQGQVETEHTVVGERDMGDARYDYVGLVQRWFDHWLKGADNGVTKEPKVRAYHDGREPVEDLRHVAAEEHRSRPVLPGQRRKRQQCLSATAAYDDQTSQGDVRRLRLRPHAPGPVTRRTNLLLRRESRRIVRPGRSRDAERRAGLHHADPHRARRRRRQHRGSLYLASNVKDTDLTIKLVDVGPDGKAFNLDEGILRVRWREGWRSRSSWRPARSTRWTSPRSSLATRSPRDTASASKCRAAASRISTAT